MELELQIKLKEDQKMHDYLKENSSWIKDLNRNPLLYKRFTEEMKEKYRARVTDKISDAIDNIDLVSSVLSTLK